MNKEQLITSSYLGGAMLSLLVLFSAFVFSVSDNRFPSSEESSVADMSDESNENINSSSAPLGQTEQIGRKENTQWQGDQNNTPDTPDFDSQKEKTKSRAQDQVEDNKTNNQNTDDFQSSFELNSEESDTSNQSNQILRPKQYEVFSTRENMQVKMQDTPSSLKVRLEESLARCGGDKDCIQQMKTWQKTYDKGVLTSKENTISLNNISPGKYYLALYDQNGEKVGQSDDFAVIQPSQEPSIESIVPFEISSSQIQQAQSTQQTPITSDANPVSREGMVTFGKQDSLFLQWKTSPHVFRTTIQLSSVTTDEVYTLVSNLEGSTSMIWKYTDQSGKTIPNGIYEMTFHNSLNGNVLETVQLRLRT